MSSTLRAGPFRLRYQRGELREIRCGEHEVLRRVYPVFQDLNWTNRRWRTLEERIVHHEDAFELSYTAISSTAPCHLKVTASGTSDGTVSYTAVISADETFWRNRLGLCVLHPITETVGAPVEIEHTDGSVELSVFPEQISPHQPFTDVRAMSYRVGDSFRATLRFSGEVFETEDHRNWSDASLKTYCTPIALPFPVEVAAGTRIEHSMLLTLDGDTSTVEAAPTRATIEIGGDLLPLPRIGVELDAPSGAVAEFAYFTEFNRDPGAASDAEVVMFAITPQVHFFDDESLVQNTATHGVIAENARRLAGDREVWVRPVTLRPRYNPNATGPEPDFTNLDDRQGSWFTQAWTAMSIRSFAISGAADVISYFELDGPRGVAGTPTAELFEELAASQGVLATRSTLPLTADALALVQHDSVLLLCANFSPIEQVVELTGAVNEELQLPAHSVTRIRRER